jgi:hypothetical protein
VPTRMYSITCRLVILADPCSSACAILRESGPLEEKCFTIEKRCGGYAAPAVRGPELCNTNGANLSVAAHPPGRETPAIFHPMTIPVTLPSPPS